MFAILVLILMSSQINCHSICEAIKPNGVFNGLQIYRKYESYSDSHLVMNNRNGTHWEFNITSDGQYSYKMDDSMATTTVDALHQFGCVAKDLSSTDPLTYQNCLISAANESHLTLKCKPTAVMGSGSFKMGDYVIVPKPPKTIYIEKVCSVFFFDRKTKDIEFVYDSYLRIIYECHPNRPQACKRKPPLFVDQMNKTLFKSIEGVVDFTSSDGIDSYFILFQIDGRPKYCITSADEPISPECNSSEKLTNLFGECFDTVPSTVPSTVTPSHPSISTLVWVLIVVVLLVVVIVIVFGIVFMRRRRDEGTTDLSSFLMVSSNPTL